MKALLAKGTNINAKNKFPIEDFDTGKSSIGIVRYRIANKWEPVNDWEEVLKYFK